MNDERTRNDVAPAPLSDEERAAAFAQANTPVGRNGRMRVGRPSIPSRMVVLVTSVFVVMALTGLLIEHLFGGTGHQVHTSNSPPSRQGPGHQLSSTWQAFMNLHTIGAVAASPVTLLDQHRREWSLLTKRGSVVVLTFFNATCNDICPVEGAEIRQAISLLGSHATKVEFAIVNSDPGHTSIHGVPAALRATGLSTQPTVHFLTGSLPELNAVWVAYGLGVKVGALANQVAHNDLMYFITPKGTMGAVAVPFANQAASGRFTLASSEIRRFAKGIASEAISLSK